MTVRVSFINIGYRFFEMIRAEIQTKNTGPFLLAMGFSCLFHALLLLMRFEAPDFKKTMPTPPALDVVLVNSKTRTKPAHADVLAQAHLDGGGNTDAARRAKTPLPLLPEKATAEFGAHQKQVEALEQQTQNLLTQIQAKARVENPIEAHKKEENLPSVAELLQQGLDAAKLEAEIAKEVEAYQQRPKRRFVGTRATEYRFARYVEDWRLKMERVGNVNYPAVARESRLYGSLVLTVSIRADGSLENIEINRSSGKKILDAAAIRIVNLAAPFAPFSPEMRQDTDVLHITRTWTFTREDTLQDSPGVGR